MVGPTSTPSSSCRTVETINTFHTTNASLPSTSHKSPRKQAESGIRACHFNANSLRTRIESLKYFLSKQSQLFHIIAVSETKLGPIVEDSIVSLEGYTLLRRDRKTSGGGVALYVHNSLSVVKLASSSGTWNARPGLPEYLFCEVKQRNSAPIFAGVVYRPPHAPFTVGHDNNFIVDLVTFLHNYGTKVIMGDFNSDPVTNPADASYISDLIADNNLSSIPYGATYHTGTSDSVLDLCFVDSNDIVENYGKTEVPFADGHDLITVTLKSSITTPDLIDFTYRDYNSVDSTALCGYLRECDWSLFHTENTLEERLSLLYDHLNNAISLHVPTKSLSHKKAKHRLWFTNEIDSLVCERDRRYRRYRRTRLRDDLQSYRSARDEAHEAINNAKIKFYQARLERVHDSKRIWRELRNLGLCSSGLDSQSPFPADELNMHFSSITFDSMAPSVSDYLRDLTLTDEQFPLFTFSQVSLMDVRKAVMHFSSNARGEDNIPLSVITAALPEIAPYVMAVFNQSIKESVFPSKWKKSLVLALNKVPSPSTMSDMRPIALLSFLSKLLERLIHQQLLNYVETCSLIDPFQTGYRTGHSTQTTLLKLTDDIREGMDKRHVTLLLLFDFSRAFDSVCHVTLLKKLRTMGLALSAIRWIASYLMEREQAVLDSTGKPSSFSPLNKGVPQGSVLGPLLFALYVADITEGFQDQVAHLIFADDLQVYTTFPLSEIAEKMTLMQAHANLISHWALENKLKLNLLKTKAIVIGSYHYINELSKLDINGIVLHGAFIRFESSVCSLGVTLDSKLNWKKHVSGICGRSYSLLYRLNFFRKSTNFALRKHLIESLLFPIIDYCCLVICDLSAELELKLQRVINAGIRYIYGIRKRERITPYRTSLKWLSVNLRRKYFASTLAYRILKTSTPHYLNIRFKPNESTRPVRGEKKPLCIPPFHGEYLQRAFYVATSYIWNSIPTAIRDCDSLYSFKKCIFIHFLSLEAGHTPLLQPHL